MEGWKAGQKEGTCERLRCPLFAPIAPLPLPLRPYSGRKEGRGGGVRGQGERIKCSNHRFARSSRDTRCDTHTMLAPLLLQGQLAPIAARAPNLPQVPAQLIDLHQPLPQAATKPSPLAHFDSSVKTQRS